jgi:hypothetical protein
LAGSIINQEEGETMKRIDITNKKPNEVLDILLANPGHIESDVNNVWVVVE